MGLTECLRFLGLLAGASHGDQCSCALDTILNTGMPVGIMPYDPSESVKLMILTQLPALQDFQFGPPTSNLQSRVLL